MKCVRCQQENAPTTKFCGECGTPLTAANAGSPPVSSYAEIASALSEALDRQEATAELLRMRTLELADTQEQQTATSEILRVIASSPTDLQPVMDVVAESAARFCGATNAAILRLEGERLRIVAAHGPAPTNQPVGSTVAASRGGVSGRAVRDRQTIHVVDLEALPETEFPETLERSRRFHVRTGTLLATPLLREDVPIGAIVMRRSEVQPFTEKQIGLAKTFADQAVIAIENVRLLQELQARNAELTESLEQQTATADILRVISSSPTDVQPVFDAIVRSAVRLCDGVFCALFRFDGKLIHLVAAHNLSSEALEVARKIFPAPPTRELTAGRAILDRAVEHIPDLENDQGYNRSFSRAIGARELADGAHVPRGRCDRDHQRWPS